MSSNDTAVDAGDGGVRVEDLHVRLGRTEVLRGVSLSARPGEVTAVVGPNGAGKSTLLKAMAGLLPHAGCIHYGRSDLSTLTHLQRARCAAYVPQRSELGVALSVTEVVAQGRYAHDPERSTLGDEDHARVAEALERVDLAELSTRSYTQLSGGEQRRVLLARALATEAPAILLDEPTASLDVGHTLQLHATLRNLAKDGRTIVTVLHDLNDVRAHTDRAFLLSGGRVAGSGAPLDVLGVTPVRSIYGVELVEGGGAGFQAAAPGLGLGSGMGTGMGTGTERSSKS